MIFSIKALPFTFSFAYSVIIDSSILVSFTLVYFLKCIISDFTSPITTLSFISRHNVGMLLEFSTKSGNPFSYSFFISEVVLLT